MSDDSAWLVYGWAVGRGRSVPGTGDGTGPCSAGSQGRHLHEGAATVAVGLGELSSGRQRDDVHVSLTLLILGRTTLCCPTLFAPPVLSLTGGPELADPRIKAHLAGSQPSARGMAMDFVTAGCACEHRVSIRNVSWEGSARQNIRATVPAFASTWAGVRTVVHDARVRRVRNLPQRLAGLLIRGLS